MFYKEAINAILQQILYTNNNNRLKHAMTFLNEIKGVNLDDDK